MTPPPSVFLFCGETSADHHGAGLARSMQELHPEIRLYGVGGEPLRAAGVTIIRDNQDLAVVGFLEVVRHYPALRRVFYQVLDFIREQAIELVVLIDYPGFNLRLARALQALPVRVVYYISPQIWAWGADRLKIIQENVDRMIVIFPFEKELYQEAKVPVSFVGHPLIDHLDPELNPVQLTEFLKHDSARRPLIGFLPGSRRGEIKNHMQPLLESIPGILAACPGASFVISAASPALGETIRQVVLEWSRVSGHPSVPVFEGNVNEIMKLADVVVVASGTASLQTALFGTPLVVIYKIHPLSYWWIRSRIKVDAVSLVNLVAGREVVPELLQSECNGGRIAAEVLRYLSDAPYRETTRVSLKEVRDHLGEGGASRRAAGVVLEELHAALS